MTRVRTAIILLFVFASLNVRGGTLDAEMSQFFETQVRPLLVQQCYQCHSGEGGKKLKGNLSLKSRQGVLHGGDTGPAAVPGDVAHSLLIKAVRYNEPDLKMPPDDHLSVAQVAVLEKWVAMGLPWPAERMVASTEPTTRSVAFDDHREDFW